MLHDNLDGTLSFRGHYDPGRTGHDKKPSLVISRGPPPPDEPPPIEPSVVLKDQPAQPPGPPIDLVRAHQMAYHNSPLGLSVPAMDEKGPWRALWEYCQPFLIHHKGEKLPEKGHVLFLVGLPKVRDIEWNHPWLANHPFTDSHPRDVSALLIQLTGEEAATPCRKCTEGRGPFKGCIMISSEAHPIPLRSIHACANCFYHYGQTYCSHKEWGAQRNNDIFKQRMTKFINSSKQARSLVPGFASGTTSTPTPDRMSEVETSGSEMPPILDDQDTPEFQQPETNDKADSEDLGRRRIIMAEPGRPYDMWPGTKPSRPLPLICCLIFSMTTSLMQNRR